MPHVEIESTVAGRASGCKGRLQVRITGNWPHALSEAATTTPGQQQKTDELQPAINVSPVTVNAFRIVMHRSFFFSPTGIVAARFYPFGR